MYPVGILLLIAAASCSGQDLFLRRKLIASIKLNMPYSCLHGLCSVSLHRIKSHYCDERLCVLEFKKKENIVFKINTEKNITSKF